MITTFTYRPLRKSVPAQKNTPDASNQSDIRLLELLPGRNAEEICCNLIYHALTEDLEYEALSYTWGCTDRVFPILCGSGHLRVTKTLREALTALRHRTKKRTLWIDQLCINQEDINERNDQVKMMHRIYKCAKRTIVFLDSGGKPDLNSKLNILTLLRELRRAKRFGAGDTIKGYQDLLSHPWFQRVWILQEIGMSDIDKVLVYYRGSILKWRDLSTATNFLGAYESKSSYDLIQITPSVARHRMIMSKWTTIAGADMGRLASVDRYGHMNNKYNKKLYSYFYLWIEPRLTETLQDSRFCLATDPSDKIFSLLNMLLVDPAQDRYAHLLTVDYFLSVAEVYARAVRYCVEKEQSLEVICYKDGQSENVGLPTWVPDWTSQRLFPIHRIPTPLHYRSQFLASATTKRTWLAPRSGRNNDSPIATFSSDGRMMTLNGHRLDSVSQIGSIWQAPLDTADEDLFNEWVSIYTGGNPTELVSCPFKPESWLLGIQTAPQSICDFWLRVGRHARLMASDTLSPFHSIHVLQEEWKHSAYHRKRRRRGLMLYRSDMTAFLFYKDWLAMMLPYASVGRRIATSRDGYFMLVPPETRENDEVYFLLGVEAALDTS